MTCLANQKGQAIIAMLAFIIILAIALVYLFNTSQLLTERTQAKVLADHAAYNTATKQAQLLNANAYMNKAKIVNQLALAQAVSISSWAEHFEEMPQNTAALNMIPGVGPVIHRGIQANATAMQGVSETQSLYVTSNAIATSLISRQQQLLNESALLAIKEEPELLLGNSSIGQGFRSQIAPSSLMNSRNFIHRYTGASGNSPEQRQRMKDVLLEARDAFTTNRRLRNTKSVPIPSLLISRARLEHRSGTELSNDMNQWKGVDTLSFHYRQCRFRRFRWRCTNVERPIGYGSTLARADSADNDRAHTAGYNAAASVNRRANAMAGNVRPSWDARNHNLAGEYGVPEYWDLSTKELAKDKPYQDIVIRITKSSQALDTTKGISEFKVGKAIDITSDDSMSALSTAQVHFERPLQDRQGKSSYLNSGKYEKASLFNPYWHVRLVDNTVSGVGGL